MGKQCDKSDNPLLPLNRSIAFGLGAMQVLCMVGLLVCAICEVTAIGELTSQGAGWGLLLFNISAVGYSFGTWRRPSLKCVKGLFMTCCLSLGFAVIFLVGQMIRVIFLVGHESYKYKIYVENMTGAAAILYTQLALMIVLNMCLFATLILSGNCIAEAGKREKPQPNEEENRMAAFFGGGGQVNKT